MARSFIQDGWIWISWKWNTNSIVTVSVDVESGTITQPPPILKKFKNQPIENLYNWLKSKDLLWIEYKPKERQGDEIQNRS